MVINAAFYGARNPFHIYMCRLPNVPRRHFDVILTLLCLSSNSACTVSCDFCHYQILFISFYASFFFLDFNFYPLFHHHRVPWLYIYYSRIKDYSNIQNAKDIRQPQWVSSIGIQEYTPANTWRLAWDMSKRANAFMCLNTRVWRIWVVW